MGSPGGYFSARCTGIDQAPISADRALELALPGLVVGLDQIDAKILAACASSRISETTRAWLVRDGSAPSRIRPALGQPVSPIRISLPGNATAIRLRMASTWAAAYLRADRKVLPIRQDVDGDEVDGVVDFAVAQPELPDVGIGDGNA